MTTTEPDVGLFFCFAAVGLDHAQAFGQIDGLLRQGCEVVGLSSDDPTPSIAAATRDRCALSHGSKTRRARSAIGLST